MLEHIMNLFGVVFTALAFIFLIVVVILSLFSYAMGIGADCEKGDFWITFFRPLSASCRKELEKRNEKREKEHKLQQEKHENEGIIYRLGVEVLNTFSVDLKTINETNTQDEIIRIVNLLAYRVAVACVNSDKSARGEKVELYVDPDENEHFSGRPWSVIVTMLKVRWLNRKNLALQICPELKDRLPHFSEFEPLKSYNTEHLLQKKAKQQSISK